MYNYLPHSLGGLYETQKIDHAIYFRYVQRTRGLQLKIYFTRNQNDSLGFFIIIYADGFF